MDKAYNSIEMLPVLSRGMWLGGKLCRSESGESIKLWL